MQTNQFHTDGNPSNHPEISGIGLSDDLNPIVLPLKLYEFFMVHGKEGREAKDVWEHLVYTARRQKTNQVWAKDTYLKKGLGMGDKALKNAKRFLREHNLIVYVAHHEHGKIKAWYIRVNACAQVPQANEILVTCEESSSGSNSTRVAFNPSGKDEQILKSHNEMLKNTNQPGGLVGSETQEAMKKHHIPDNPDSHAQIEAAPKEIQDDLDGFWGFLDMQPGIDNMIGFKLGCLTYQPRIKQYLDMKANNTQRLEKVPCPVCGYPHHPNVPHCEAPNCRWTEALSPEEVEAERARQKERDTLPDYIAKAYEQ